MAGMPKARAQELLRQSLDCLQRDSVFEAEARLGTVLEGWPEDPDALQLLGVIRRMQGNLSEAEELYRRSLAISPDQPQVHHNLGNLYRSLARFDEAIAAQQEAIRLKKNYGEAYLSLGLALHESGNPKEAEKFIRRALYIQPNLIIAKQSLAAVLNDLGRPREAESILVRALESGTPNSRQLAALEHNLGVSLQLQGRHEAALGVFDAAQSKVPEIPLTDYSRGNSLKSLGRLEQAILAYGHAIDRNPLDFRAHYELNQLLYRIGDDANFLRSYDLGAAAYSEAGGFPLDKANFLLQIGDLEAARAHFERAIELLPQHVMPRDGLGLTLARMGEYPEAIRAHEAVLKMEPENADGWRNYAETLLRSGDASKARDAAERSLSIQPLHQGSLALLGTAYQLLGDPRGDSLIDCERFVRSFELSPPEGYSDIESFNRDLQIVLSESHHGKREAVTQPLRGGTQSLENLFDRKHRLVDAFKAMVYNVVSAYIDSLEISEDHVFLKRRRDGLVLSSAWSSRLHDGGYHMSHFHPKGWISSAYYVEVPDVVEDAREREGWLKFGEPPFETELSRKIHYAVQPKAGRLVLFPSYMWHGTTPFHSSKPRTSVCFDVVPE